MKLQKTIRNLEDMLNASISFRGENPIEVGVAELMREQEETMKATIDWLKTIKQERAN